MGRKIQISGGFFAVMALLLCLDSQGILPWLLLACALHEVGHALTVMALRGSVETFRLTAVGGELVLSRQRPFSYGEELMLALSGTGVNLTVGVVCALVGGYGKLPFLFFISGIHLCLGCFNLLPIYPMDGGRALFLMLSALTSPDVAWRGVHTLSVLCAILLLSLGILLLQRGQIPLTLLLTALWLVIRTIKMPNWTE